MRRSPHTIGRRGGAVAPQAVPYWRCSIAACRARGPPVGPHLPPRGGPAARPPRPRKGAGRSGGRASGPLLFQADGYGSNSS